MAVCSRRYVVNVALPSGDPRGSIRRRACPAFVRPKPDPFRPRPGEQIAEQRIVVPGPKMRSLASVDDGRAALRADVHRVHGLGFGAAPVPNMSLAPGQ